MKTVKLVIGIISFVLALFILLQSCIAGLGNSMAENGELGGSAGFLFALCLIVGGVIAIATRSKANAGAYVAAGFYIVGGLIGIGFAGSYSDLYIWSGIGIAFGIVFIVGSIVRRKR